MKLTKKYCRRLRRLIGENELESVFQELTRLLQNSPRLDDAVMQSARWSDLKNQISLGLLSYEQSEISKNKIRTGLLALVNEVEKKIAKPAIQKEKVERVFTASEKNIVVESSRPEVKQEDSTVPSRLIAPKIRLGKSAVLLFTLVLIFTIVAAFSYQGFQKAEESLSLTVSLDKRSITNEVGNTFKGGKLVLRYGVEMDTLPLIKQAKFTDIPSKYRGKKVLLKFSAEGFQGLDTIITLNKTWIILPIFPDNAYAQL